MEIGSHFEAEALNRSIKSTVFRLQRDLPCETEEVEDENEDENEEEA